MTSGPDICPLETPPSASWLNKSFLETALRTGDSPQTLRVTSFDVKPAVGKGDNYSSETYRVKIHTADGRVINLIVKSEFPSETELARIMKKTTGFLRETHMFRSTAVKMSSILQEASPGVCSQFAARYLYSCPGAIVLQDLCAEGFKMAERRQGLDLSHSLLVMSMLARFHAASVVLHDRDPDELSLYDKSMLTEPGVQESFPNFVSGSLHSVAKAVQTWPGYAERYAGKLEDLAVSMPDSMIELTQRDDTAFNVLIHGDLWVGNMLFRYSEDGPVDVRFVDFQLLYFSSPAIDLQYFFSTSLSEDVRVNHLDSLMKEYHNTLSDCLNALGYSRKLITLADLWKEYDNKALYGLYGVCCVLPIALADKAVEVHAMCQSGTSQENDVYSGSSFRKTLQRILPIFEEKGVFQYSKST